MEKSENPAYIGNFSEFSTGAEKTGFNNRKPLFFKALKFERWITEPFSTRFSTTDLSFLSLDLLDQRKNFRMCVFLGFDLDFHLFDGGHDRCVITVKNLADGLQGQGGQISDDVDRHVSCLRDIILSFLGFPNIK